MVTLPNQANNCAGFFSMHKTPFTLTPSKSNIYQHENYTHVKNTILFSISSGERLIKLTGDIGVGKTLLVNDVLSSIDHQHYPIRILNPKISPKDLLCQIIDEFGRPYPVDATIEQLMRLLQFTLHEHYTRTDANMLVLIDDAHLLSNNTLLIIDKISAWSTPSRSLLQFILVGSIELDEKLCHPILASMKNNIRFADCLQCINRAEMRDYVQSCIQSTDTLDEPQFTDKALQQLHKLTAGNPSKINALAYKALLLAYGKGFRTIKHQYVKYAYAEGQQDAKTGRKIWPFVVGGWLIINAVLATLYFGGFV